jgi:glycogen(starch) synthase
MKPTTVLMFGWEFPPHISGGLGTACYGLTKSLRAENTDILFVVPKAYGDENIPIINSSDVVLEDPNAVESIRQETVLNPETILQIQIASTLIPYTHHQWETQEAISQWNYQFNEHRTKEVKLPTGKKYAFSGTYGPALLDEVNKYSEVARRIARHHSFDIIHAHDWLTFLAGIEARKESGKPLIVHVHATEYDRAGIENINLAVFEIERKGMEQADRVIAVSQWTKDIIVSKYAIEAGKVEVVHNGVLSTKNDEVPFLPKLADQVVTFLGRITWQKGPQYFVEAARKVLQHFPDAHFIMAGSGDLLPKMIETVAQLKMSDRFHFTGFLKGKQINQVWNVSDVYVMPSVSEPFGITPLEAIQAGVPVIVSNQSGVAEVIDHAIKVDFWDTDSLADSIMNILRHKSLSTSLTKNSKKELSSITWKRAAKKINKMYYELQNGDATVY